MREAAEAIDFPIVMKPIAGAGSQDTYRANDAQELEEILRKTQHVSEVSVEEFIEGEDYTFDTVTIDGEIEYFNIAFYRPRAMMAKAAPWISQQTICRRDVDSDALAAGREMGQAVHKALGVKTGFTHMEWFRTPNDDAVFCEIAARAPGVRTVDLMNFACDLDLYRGWAEAACHGTFSQPVERKYYSAGVFKKANGEGIVRKIEGVDRILSEFGHHICAIDLTPVGKPAKDWKRSVLADGFVMLRHPDLEATMAMANQVATTVQLHAA